MKKKKNYDAHTHIDWMKYSVADGFIHYYLWLEDTHAQQQQSHSIARRTIQLYMAMDKTRYQPFTLFTHSFLISLMLCCVASVAVLKFHLFSFFQFFLLLLFFCSSLYFGFWCSLLLLCLIFFLVIFIDNHLLIENE